MPSCVDVKSNIFENKTGPNSETVALNLAPFSSERVKNSTGDVPASKGKPIFSWRSSILGCPSLAAAIPLKSPLISINNTGTLLADNCSAKI